MHKSKRKTVLLKSLGGLLVATLLVAGVFWWTHRCPSDVGALVDLECSHERGNNPSDHSWTLKVDAAGKGTLVQERITRQISAPREILAFERALPDSRLCDLPSEIGGQVLDGARNTMRIKTTALDKTIALGYVPPDDPWDSAVLRAEKLWQLAENLTKGPNSTAGKK
ncbi:MAG TPA: hypothetical protein VFG04_21520 [Planctomycetaceae bacterium]|nr:hypothetical protein [Planctomycetaceae bacterium]